MNIVGLLIGNTPGIKKIKEQEYPQKMNSEPMELNRRRENKKSQSGQRKAVLNSVAFKDLL